MSLFLCACLLYSKKIFCIALIWPQWTQQPVACLIWFLPLPNLKVFSCFRVPARSDHVTPQQSYDAKFGSWCCSVQEALIFVSVSGVSVWHTGEFERCTSAVSCCVCCPSFSSAPGLSTPPMRSLICRAWRSKPTTVSGLDTCRQELGIMWSFSIIGKRLCDWLMVMVWNVW